MSIASEIETIVGPVAMKEICDRFGGRRAYIPVVPPSRAEHIRFVFDQTLPIAASVGAAYDTVAEVLHVSSRTVQRAVASSQILQVEN